MVMYVRRVLGLGALLLLACGAAFGENPFIGRWAVESFAQEEALVFEFRSDTEMLMSASGEVSEVQPYEADPQAMLLTLPMSEGDSTAFPYAWQGEDVFVLFMTDELLEQMVSAFSASLPNGVNDLTDEIIGELREAVRGVFATRPFMRATRLQTSTSTEEP